MGRGDTPVGEGPLNRDGMPKIPPGQRATDKWPVLDLEVQPEIPLNDWNLTIPGLVEKPAMFNWEQFMSFPQVEDVSDFHCVTTWSRLDNHWTGVRFSDITNHCQLKPEAKFVYIKAYVGRSHEVRCFAGPPMGRQASRESAWRPVTHDHSPTIRLEGS